MRPPIFLALALAFAPPLYAQTAPAGWTTQTRDNGAVGFTPPDLKAGEVYSVTVYDGAPLDGQTPEAYLHKFAGPVGRASGQLGAALRFTGKEGRVVVGSGAYNGPNGAELGVVFFGVSLDGAKVHVERVLFSRQSVFDRYQANQNAIFEALATRARDEAGEGALSAPQEVRAHLTPGGALVPGVYAGQRFVKGQPGDRFRLHIYPDGQFRLCDENDKDIQTRGSRERVGQVAYNRVLGKLEVDSLFDLANGYDYQHCYFGRDAANHPLIYNTDGVAQSVTELRYVGANTKRLAPQAEHARQAAIRAEERRYKFIVAPGKGVKDAQIAAILQDGAFDGRSFVNHAYLLLRDGTIHAELPPVALDQFDVAVSRQKEPTKWGRWRGNKGKTEVSWAGKPFEELEATRAVPAPVGLRLNTRFEGADASQFSYQIFGVSFSKAGRFSRNSRGGVSTGNFGGAEGSVTATTTWDEGGVGSTTSVVGGATIQGGTVSSSVIKKKNPAGDREGTYSFSGYTLTLRYDNGKTERIPAFFIGEKREMLWFDGAIVLQQKD